MQYQKEDIRRKILQAGMDEFLAKGYAGGKISSIAKTAGVPIGNFYRYFEGKSGLLDAIVTDTYNLILKRTAEIMLQNELRLKPLDEIASTVTDIITGFLDHEKEFLILLDKCEGSKYADFKQNLYGIVDKYINDILFNSKTKEDEIFCSVISKAFLDMIFDVLRKGDKDFYAGLIKRLLFFCFYEAEKRV